METKGPFKIKSSKTVYQNPWIKVTEDQVVRPDGKDGIFGTIDAGSGVSVLALNEKNKAYVIKEFHYAINRYEYILPSGGLDQDEDPQKAAVRELKEETGLTAKSWTNLGTFNPLTMIVSSPFTTFLAEELSEGEMADFEKDLIEVEKVPFGKLLDLVKTGQLTHAGSVITILLTARAKGF